MRKTILFIFLVSFYLIEIASGQSFEGWIAYKLEAKNPNPEMIPDSVWNAAIKEQFGERGYMLQKYFYKNHNYMSELEAGKNSGFQAYNPENGLIYSWQMNSDTALTIDSKKFMDEIVEIIDNEGSETIIGIICKSITIKSKMGSMTLWYNPEYLKVDPQSFSGHKYGHWEAIASRIQCFPLKIESNGFMNNSIQTAIDFKQTSVDDQKFKIPEFKHIMESPMN